MKAGLGSCSELRPLKLVAEFSFEKRFPCSRSARSPGTTAEASANSGELQDRLALRCASPPTSKSADAESGQAVPCRDTARRVNIPSCAPCCRTRAAWSTTLLPCPAAPPEQPRIRFRQPSLSPFMLIYLVSHLQLSAAGSWSHPRFDWCPR